ncbi:MAG: hypothetical protein HY241_17255 [Actinobacteria bacterium]|nr:hypothetical protein [Actinomycetota bacterium]
MPALTPTRPRRLSRRVALVALAAGVGLVVTGCGSGAAGGTPHPTPLPDPLLPDLEDERRLLAAYEATMAAFPSLVDRLAPLRTNHAAHVAALARAIGVPRGARPSSIEATMATPGPDLPIRPDTSGATGPPGTTGPPGPGPGPATGIAGTPESAVAALRQQERDAMAARTESAVRAAGPRAALLASISAGSACHEAVLGW